MMCDVVVLLVLFPSAKKQTNKQTNKQQTEHWEAWIEKSCSWLMLMSQSDTAFLFHLPFQAPEPKAPTPYTHINIYIYI